MFTRKRWTPPNIPPSLAPDVQQYLRDQNKSISDYLLSLEAKGSLTINEATFDGTVGSNTPAAGTFTTVDASSYGSFGSDAVVWGKTDTALAANADLTLTNAYSGLYLIRNNTDGGMAIVLLEHGVGTRTEISDPAAFLSVAGADPGAGANQIWFSNSGTTVTLRNRYGVSKSIVVTMLLVSGTPS